jgi:uncharacterized membrane protein
MRAKGIAPAGAILAVLLALSACSAPASQPPVPATALPSAPASAATGPAALAATDAAPGPDAASGGAAPADATPWQRLRGAAIMGKDGYGVTLCGESTQRIVLLDAPARAALDGFLANGAHTFRVDGWGDLPDAGHAHFASFERFDVEGRICEDEVDGVSFRGRGTEPFWNIEIRPGQLAFERPDHARLAAQAGTLVASQDGASFEATTSEGRLLARFSPGACHDGMSEAQFAWRAEVTLGMRTWSGCGYRGGSTLERATAP